MTVQTLYLIASSYMYLGSSIHIENVRDPDWSCRDYDDAFRAVDYYVGST